jgi:hypothetical protein
MKAQLKQSINSDSCAWDGCSEHGQYPAPKSPDRLNERYHFCLAHVREYNKSWNFFRNMNAQQIDDFYTDSITGHRPTSKIKAGGVNYREDDLRAAVFDFFGDTTSKQKNNQSVPDNEKKALTVLGLKFPVTMLEIKRKYKELAKLYHPDINGNAGEDKLKVINQAYSLLKNSCYFK